MSLSDAQVACAYFAAPFILLSIIWLTAAAAFAVFDPEHLHDAPPANRKD